jgi:catechol 2,3-dioxygenase-like lactoylglutathione lyase family enzyme
MTINHLNLVVPNVAEATHFFTSYFAFTRAGGDDALAVLANAAGFTLVLMRGKDAYPKAFHIGFMLTGPALVDDLHAKLHADGLKLPEAPKKIRDSYGFYFHYDNLFIEVGTYK